MWYTTEDARTDAFREEKIHFLKDGFQTACGLGRHFSVSSAPQIAVKISHVTCNECKRSKKYKDWMDALINERIHKDNEDT